MDDEEPAPISGTGATAPGAAVIPDFRAVYDAHFAFVWKSLRRLGLREADVPDAVQEVFLVVHRKLGEFEGRSKLTTWLFGIALRVARDRQRLASAKRQVSDDSAIADHADESIDVHGDAERRQGLAMLESILDTLPIEQRAVFTLFELDGMSTAEIAELCEIPLGTVYTRLRLAREAFQRQIGRVRARSDFQEGVLMASPARARAAGAQR
jgi:RNA polymerase sigma-70 factor (ECF subfamily)